MSEALKSIGDKAVVALPGAIVEVRRIFFCSNSTP